LNPRHPDYDSEIPIKNIQLNQLLNLIHAFVSKSMCLTLS